MKKLTFGLSLLLGAALVATAQQPQTAKPGTQQPSSQQTGGVTAPEQATPLQPLAPAGQEEAVDPNQNLPIMQPDSTPLSSILDMTLGVPETQQRNFFVPSIRYAHSIQSENSMGSPVDYAWHNRGDFGANVRLEHALLPGGSIHYNGIMNWNSAQNEDVHHYHQVGVVQSFSVNRWKFTAVDEASYSPSSAFGYSGLQGLGTPIGGLNQLAQFGPMSSLLRPSALPDQTIMQDDSPRISNTSSLETQYQLTGRSSINMNGSFGLLRGMGDSSISDSNQYSLGGGFDHRMSARSTLGALYSYSSIIFPSTSGEIVTHEVQVATGRKITGRLAFNASGGAQFVNINTAGIPERNTIAFGGDTNLTYQRGRRAMTFHAYRHVTSGSGILPGAMTSALQGSVTQEITRLWSVAFNGGYAHNSGFGGKGFDTEFGGVSVNRKIGRYTGVFLNYNVSHQTPIGACAGLLCDSQFRHVFSMGFNWSYRPIQVF